jgi:hypothetical protein
MQSTVLGITAAAMSAALLLAPLSMQAQTYTVTGNPNYTVSISTAPLKQSPLQANGPFTLDFQLVQGDQPYGDTVTINAFDFINGGYFTGTPFQSGATSVTTGIGGPSFQLTDTGFFNEIQQAFTPGDALIFSVSSTGPIPPPNAIPAEFSFSILDGSGSELPTAAVNANQPASNSAFVIEDFDPTVNVYQAAGSYAPLGTPIVTFQGAGSPSVPEPNTLLGTLTLCGCLLGQSVRRFKKRARGVRPASEATPLPNASPSLSHVQSNIPEEYHMKSCYGRFGAGASLCTAFLICLTIRPVAAQHPVYGIVDFGPQSDPVTGAGFRATGITSTSTAGGSSFQVIGLRTDENQRVYVAGWPQVMEPTGVQVWFPLRSPIYPSAVINTYGVVAASLTASTIEFIDLQFGTGQVAVVSDAPPNPQTEPLFGPLAGINDVNDIIGGVYGQAGQNQAAVFSYTPAISAQFTYDQVLPTLGDQYSVSQANGISNRYTYAGHAWIAGSSQLPNSGFSDAVLWDYPGGANPAPLYDLGTLYPGDKSSEAWAVNDAGVSVGDSGIPAFTFWNPSSLPLLHGFVHADPTQSLTPNDTIGVLPGDIYSSALAINNTTNHYGAYQVVGWSENNRGDQRAVLWDSSSRTLTDLNTLTQLPFMWTLTQATAINDARWILCTAADNNGQLHSMLLIPTSPSFQNGPVPAQASPVTNGAITVQRGGFRYVYGDGTFHQNVAITNTSAQTIAGPIHLAISGLTDRSNPAHALTLLNASGFSLYPPAPPKAGVPVGTPYVTMVGPGGSLGPGQSVQVTLQFPAASPAGFSGISYLPLPYFGGASP